MRRSSAISPRLISSSARYCRRAISTAPSPALERTESVDLLGLAAEEAVRVDATVDGTPVEVEGDATPLRRLIRNLLENAVKHGEGPIHIAVTGHEDAACLVVSDHGPGIAPAERERVFEPFYRPAGHSESSDGWGLGLSLVRQIAARHGGRRFVRGQRCRRQPVRRSSRIRNSGHPQRSHGC
jgi:signal transduction histidine kinase